MRQHSSCLAGQPSRRCWSELSTSDRQQANGNTWARSSYIPDLSPSTEKQRSGMDRYTHVLLTPSTLWIQGWEALPSLWKLKGNPSPKKKHFGGKFSTSTNVSPPPRTQTSLTDSCNTTDPFQILPLVREDTGFVIGSFSPLLSPKHTHTRVFYPRTTLSSAGQGIA